MGTATGRKKPGPKPWPRERKRVKRTIFLLPAEVEWLCKRYGSGPHGLQALVREAMAASTDGQSGEPPTTAEPDLSDLDRSQARHVKVAEDPADPLAGFCERCRRIRQVSCPACKALVAKRQRR